MMPVTLATAAHLSRRVGQATPGDTLVHGRRSLAVDACDPASSERRRRDPPRVAGRARPLAARGAVRRVQRRRGPNAVACRLVARLMARPRSAGVAGAAVAAHGPSGLSGAAATRRRPTAIRPSAVVRA